MLFKKAVNHVIEPDPSYIIHVCDISSFDARDTFSLAAGVTAVKLVDGRPSDILLSDGKRIPLLARGETLPQVKLVAMNEDVTYTLLTAATDLTYRARGVETNKLCVKCDISFRATQFSSFIKAGKFNVKVEDVKATVNANIKGVIAAAFYANCKDAKIDALDAKTEALAEAVKFKVQEKVNELRLPITIQSVVAQIHIPEDFYKEVTGEDTFVDGIFGTIDSASDAESRWEEAARQSNPPARRYCDKCGRELPAGATACPNCGRPIH